MAPDLLSLAQRLTLEGEPFALAIVVRCEPPTSAKPGAKALIHKDGAVTGWIGGSCAEPVVVREALEALADGEPRFIALVGEGGTAPERRGGVQAYTMSCHSGGTLEIYVEPVLPKRHLVIVGRGPVVDALARLGDAMGFALTLVSSDLRPPEITAADITPRSFVVVATHGASDEDAIEQALRGRAAYVSLVASRRRAAAIAEVLRSRGVPAHEVARINAPAGLDIGAAAPEEIAVSILAEIVQVARRRVTEAPVAPATPEAVAASRGAQPTLDPVCGMVVDPAAARHQSAVAGRFYYFCCAHCKRVFDQDPSRYAGQLST
jgi:xanthine dehydrogenase accessory factor